MRVMEFVRDSHGELRELFGTIVFRDFIANQYRVDSFVTTFIPSADLSRMIVIYPEYQSTDSSTIPKE